MVKTGHLWGKIEAQIGAPDILASTVKLWFKNAVDKPRPSSTTDEPTTAYQHARECTTKGMPRFGNLPLETQRLLKGEVRTQYPTLPLDKTTEKLIEGAFDSVFKGKHQWVMEKERGRLHWPVPVIFFSPTHHPCSYFFSTGRTNESNQQSART